MRIPLSDFKLPGNPGLEGDIVYKSIDYDVNSGRESDGHTTYAYFVCGWREDDGAGVLIHGTPSGGITMYDWRVPRLISAPSDPSQGLTVTRTEFHHVESLEGPVIRLCGCVQTEETGDNMRGFFYEGFVDGSGDWYSLQIEGSDDTVVKGSNGQVLVCDDMGSSDSVFVYNLDGHIWTKLHCGYALDWSVDEIIHAGDLYIIRLLHADGRRSDVTYKP